MDRCTLKDGILTRKVSSKEPEKPLLGDKKAVKTFSHDFPYIFLLLALLAQTLKGFGPGFNRYLQIPRNSGRFDALTLVTYRNGLSTILLAPLVFYTLGLRVFKMKRIYLLVAAWVPAQVASFYSVRFTNSYFTKLIDLSVPFTVAVISRFLLKKALPPHTVTALVICSIGAFLTFTGTFYEDGKLDFDNKSFTSSDLLGISLALVSSTSIACGLVFYSTVEKKYPTEGVVWLQNVFVLTAVAPISAGIDDWTAWTRLDNLDYIILALQFAFYLGGLFLNVYTIRRIGAPLVSTTAAWGAVVAMVFGSTDLLKERISVISGIGGGLIVVTVTLYLYAQYRRTKKAVFKFKLAGNSKSQPWTGHMKDSVDVEGKQLEQAVANGDEMNGGSARQI